MLVQTLRRHGNVTVAYDALTVLGGSLFIALLSQISIPLIFSPVPLTLQTLAVLLVGSLLGPKKGVLAVLTYLAESALGLPFLAGGAFGMASLCGATGGYLIGFVFAAYVVGVFKEKMAGFALATALIWFFGALWLSLFVGSLSTALLLGVVPFIATDLLKALVAKWILSFTSTKE